MSTRVAMEIVAIEEGDARKKSDQFKNRQKEGTSNVPQRWQEV
jgi:hypothetical protein